MGIKQHNSLLRWLFSYFYYQSCSVLYYLKLWQKYLYLMLKQIKPTYLCFQKFQGVSCVSQIWRELWCSKLENMENTLKINVFEKSILFCKYLHNGSSDPYEILYGGQLISCELKYQISWRSVHKCVRTSCACTFYHCGDICKTILTLGIV